MRLLGLQLALWPSFNILVARYVNIGQQKVASHGPTHDEHVLAVKQLQMVESGIKVYRSWAGRGALMEKAISDFMQQWKLLVTFAGSEPIVELKCALLFDTFFEVLSCQSTNTNVSIVAAVMDDNLLKWYPNLDAAGRAAKQDVVIMQAATSALNANIGAKSAKQALLRLLQPLGQCMSADDSFSPDLLTATDMLRQVLSFESATLCPVAVDEVSAVLENIRVPVEKIDDLPREMRYAALLVKFPNLGKPLVDEIWAVVAKSRQAQVWLADFNEQLSLLKSVASASDDTDFIRIAGTFCACSEFITRDSSADFKNLLLENLPEDAHAWSTTEVSAAHVVARLGSPAWVNGARCVNTCEALVPVWIQ